MNRAEEGGRDGQGGTGGGTRGRGGIESPAAPSHTPGGSLASLGPPLVIIVISCEAIFVFLCMKARAARGMAGGAGPLGGHAGLALGAEGRGDPGASHPIRGLTNCHSKRSRSGERTVKPSPAD